MKKGKLSIEELIKIVLVIIILLIVSYMVLRLKGVGAEKLAFFKSFWRGITG